MCSWIQSIAGPVTGIQANGGGQTSELSETGYDFREAIRPEQADVVDFPAAPGRCQQSEDSAAVFSKEDAKMVAGETSDVADYGSFKDSLRAPIHRWFAYPAGFSYRFVEAQMRKFSVGGRDVLVDPFAGAGTTSLTAKEHGVRSVSVEAHPYVHKVAETKLRLNLNTETLTLEAEHVAARAENISGGLRSEYPELVHKCFETESLKKLDALKEAVADLSEPDHQDFFYLALAAALRKTTTAGAGWPYIAPSEHARRRSPAEPLSAFAATSAAMIADMSDFQARNIAPSEHEMICGDAKNLSGMTEPESASLIVTSPPYLNNYDYADRTRLETYFLGRYSSWGEITRDVRSRLMVSATTQISLSEMSHLAELPDIRKASPRAYSYLRPRIEELADIRAGKKGGKTYDILVAGYCEDMLEILRQCFAVLAPGGRMVAVVGDSAPYGVHVETEKVLAMLATDTGFVSCDVEEIRKRGGKWAGNSQRHRVPLRESVITAQK